jgi:hypothetical protein
VEHTENLSYQHDYFSRASQKSSPIKDESKAQGRSWRAISPRNEQKSAKN